MTGYDIYKPFEACRTWRAVHDRLRSLSEEELRALQGWLIGSTDATRDWIRSADKDTAGDYLARGYDVVPGRRDYEEYGFDLALLHDVTSLLEGKPLPEPPDDEPVVPEPSNEESFEAFLAKCEPLAQP